MRNRSEQTICAISTPPGTGGISVIRLSGPNSLKIVSKIAPTLTQKTIRSHHVYFAKIRDQESQAVDGVVVTFFENGKSFTGEEVVEISCHGSEYIAGKIIDLLVDSGATIAEKGEFTFRAFMNNRIDLVQAESVLALIESQNQAAARVAMRQLQGHVSKKFEKFESDLTWCLAHIEASIDFSTEGIDVIDPKVLLARLTSLRVELKGLVESYSAGRLVKDGIKVVLLGKPNAGKSSLLNLISEDDRAIVTPVAGTTRDVINAVTIFDGLKFTLSDTAGLRETQDEIERIGIDRTHKEARKADVLLLVVDAMYPQIEALSAEISDGSIPVLVLYNKQDLVPDVKLEDVRKKLQKLIPTLTDEDVILTSHLDPSTRDRVLSAIKLRTGQLNVMDEAVVTSARQYEMAGYAVEMLNVSIAELEKNMGAEFIAMYLKESLLSVQRILGHVYDDQIMDRVFKEFCLGK